MVGPQSAAVHFPVKGCVAYLLKSWLGLLPGTLVGSVA